MIMMYGFNGKVLRVNLDTQKIDVELLDEKIYRKYLGGRNLGLYYLNKETSRGVDPLSPENTIIFATGVTTGVPLTGFCRHSVVAKSPLTNGFGEAEAGGFWGAELKFAGYDAIVIKGRSPRTNLLMGPRWRSRAKERFRNLGPTNARVTRGNPRRIEG